MQIRYHKILPSDYVIQCQRIESGTTYDKINQLLVGKSENFEITNISLSTSNGEEIKLSDNIECRIETNPNYDRNKVKVYHYEDGNLQLISSSGYGRYVSFENKKMGTYVILIEGVKSSINLPLIISLSVVIAVIVIALITLSIILILRKKRKNKIA